MTSDWESTSELKAEWLKLRGYLYDPVTRLPSLPMVLDEIRRRLEDGEALRLLYLDFSCAGHAEAAGGWQIHDRWLLAGTAALEACRGELFADTAVLTQLGVRSDEFLLVDSAESKAELPEQLVLRLIEAQKRDQELRELPAPQASGVILEPLPRFRPERTIYAAIGRAKELCRQQLERRHSVRLEELRRLVRTGDLVIRYQPILELDNSQIYGFEALSGAPGIEIFENPEMLFSFAEQHADALGLERMCRRQAIARLPNLTPGPLQESKLFLNCSPLAFQDPLLAEELLASGITNKVVLEVTERVAVTEWQSFHRALEALRAAGLEVALDDVGAGYSSLQAIGEIQPDYLKFDSSLIHRLHESSIKRELVATLADLANRIGASAVAEGIEQPEELAVVRSLGIKLGQGFLLGRPAEPQDLDWAGP